MKNKIDKLINNDIFIMIIIALSTIIASLWIFNKNNFFIFDDWHNLVNLPQQSFKDLFQILPTSSYCSRPVGVIIVKILLNIVGLNYLFHASFMIGIHIINALLVYYLIKKLTKNQAIAAVTSLIFAIYPVSTMPSYWEAAMFDLFGTTLVLLSTLTYLKLKTQKVSKKNYILLSILMIILYYTSLRSKEMFICLPLFLGSHSLCSYLKKFREEKEPFQIKHFLKENINLIIMTLVMILYALCIKNLNSSNQFTTNELDAYYYNFDIIGIVKNFFNYLFIYFNPKSLVYADVLTTIYFRKIYKLFILILSFSILGMSIYKIIKNDYSYLLGIIAYGLFITPVLPMPNLHAVWYLYLPAIPLAYLCADMLYHILKFFVFENRITFASLLFSLIILMFINKLSYINNFRIWWLDFAGLEKETYNYFLDLSKEYENIENVYVINVPEGYTTFFIEDGGIVNVAFDDYNLNVEIYHDGREEKDFEKNSLLIDFNDYNFTLLEEVR